MQLIYEHAQNNSILQTLLEVGTNRQAYETLDPALEVRLFVFGQERGLDFCWKTVLRPLVELCVSYGRGLCGGSGTAGPAGAVTENKINRAH